MRSGRVGGVCVCVVVVCVNNQGFNVFVFFLFLNGLLDSCWFYTCGGGAWRKLNQTEVEVSVNSYIYIRIYKIWIYLWTWNHTACRIPPSVSSPRLRSSFSFNLFFFSMKLFKIILSTLARLFLFFTPARLPSDVPVVTLFKNGTICFERRRAEGRSHRRGTKGPTAASIGLFSVAHTTVGRAWRILHIVKMKWM